jgi:CheY-like chemotaxis protein
MTALWACEWSCANSFSTPLQFLRIEFSECFQRQRRVILQPSPLGWVCVADSGGFDRRRKEEVGGTVADQGPGCQPAEHIGNRDSHSPPTSARVKDCLWEKLFKNGCCRARPQANGPIIVKTQSKVILLAEDNPDDVFIFQIMFGRAGLPHRLHIVENGQEAINWLAGKGNYADREEYPTPDLVLLDLKMPVKTGFEVLEWLQGQEAFQELPVFILSSSGEKRDVERAYKLGAANYFVKSPDLEDVLQFLRSL